ncbi:MAG: hypothetical protein L0Z50_34170 [Verrucomicrobiales bacterium]|nr:hypothetical protein [Verrucomicrobiales bacterium]
MKGSRAEAKLILRFSKDEPHLLRETEFRLGTSNEALKKTSVGNTPDFPWGKSAMSLFFCLVKYLESPPKAGVDYEHPSEVDAGTFDTLCRTLSKPGQMNEIFGHYDDAVSGKKNASVLTTKIFDAPNPTKNRKLRIRRDNLPPDSVEIWFCEQVKKKSGDVWIDREKVHAKAALRTLAENIADQFRKCPTKGKHKRPTPAALISVTPTTPPPQEPVGNALAFPAQQPRALTEVKILAHYEHPLGLRQLESGLSQGLISELDISAPKVKASPAFVKIPVWEPTHFSTGGFRLNLAVRWALNRRPGIVILRRGEFHRVFSSFAEAECLLKEATQATEQDGSLVPRVWLAIDELPSAKPDKGAWLAALTEHHQVSADDLERLESGAAKLGVMVRAGDSDATPQRMREFVASVASLLKETRPLEPLLVIHTESTSIATSIATKLRPLVDSAVGFPSEVLEVLPDFGQAQCVPGCTSSWSSPSVPGQALWRFCRQLDPDESLLRRREFKELHEALGHFGRTGLTLEKGDDGSLPHVQDVVADLDRIESNKVEAIRLLLKLAKSHGVLGMMLPALVAEMAAMEPPMRAAALEAAVPEFDLVEAWLAGLTPKTRLSIPAWWVSASPGHLESVLAALIRAAKRGDEEAEKIAKEWLPSVSPRLREAAQSVLDNAVDSSKAFWESEPKGKSLLFLGECDPAMEIPIDEVAPILLTRPEFWQLVQRLPLTIDLIRRLVHLPKKYRAVIGLCSADEWTTLKDGHVLPQVFNWRGCPQPSQHGIESL